MVVGIELIISGVVYVLTNGALAGVIIMLKKLSKKKYGELANTLKDLMRRNTEIYEMLSEAPQSQQITDRTEETDNQAREIFINEPITPSERDTEPTHRDIQLKNGNVLRLRLKKE